MLDCIFIFLVVQFKFKSLGLNLNLKSLIHFRKMKRLSFPPLTLSAQQAFALHFLLPGPEFPSPARSPPPGSVRPSALSPSVAWGPSVIPDLGEDSDSPRVREEHAARAAPTRRGPHAKAQPWPIKATPRDPLNPIEPKPPPLAFAKP